MFIGIVTDGKYKFVELLEGCKDEKGKTRTPLEDSKLFSKRIWKRLINSKLRTMDDTKKNSSCGKSGVEKILKKFWPSTGS